MLAPKRKQPFSRAQEARMQAILESAAIPGWTAAEHNSTLFVPLFGRVHVFYG